MRRLVYLDSARDDLQKIFAYITRQSGNKVIGLNFVKLLREQCTKLAALPGSLGTSRHELQQDLRSFPFKAYVIFFSLSG